MSEPADIDRITDVLEGLLRAEHLSIFHFMADADTYINPQAIELRRPLQKIVDAHGRREGELAELVFNLGGTLRPPPVSPEQQYMAYLSVGFLLPKLVHAMEQGLSRYEEAQRTLADSPAPVMSLLQKHVAEMQQELATLRQAGNASAT